MKFRTAVIGAGFIGNAHVEAIRRLGNVEIVALCDSCDAEKKAAALNIGTSYSDYKKMIDELKPDVIDICTPNLTHYEIAKYAIEHNVNFICEKPFTTTVEQAAELVSLAKEHNVKGMVNFHNRVYPMANEMREMVRNGEMGRIFSVHGEYIQDWLLYQTDYSWRLDGKQVGKTRAIADIGSHWLDLAEFTTGLRIKRVMADFCTVYPTRKKPVTQVQTFATADKNAQYENVPINTEDEAAVLLEFDNGAIGSVIVSQVFAGKKNTTVLAIAGSKKSVVWNTEKLNDLYIGHRDKPNEVLSKDAGLMHSHSSRLVSYPGGHIEGFPDAFKQAFKEFYESLEHPGDYDYATLEDGMRETVLCDAIFESAQKGQWVTVGE